MEGQPNIKTDRNTNELMDEKLDTRIGQTKKQTAIQIDTDRQTDRRVNSEMAGQRNKDTHRKQKNISFRSFPTSNALLSLSC